ncbi:hypothetical protein AB0B45_20435 [Nonomuraea sp. NPDC049152]|uniref:hypothetical protein n=1 Tax=Nonomuraea sp. NPDC049152 TaxID=3154350 RepID=UPI0033C7EABF
MDDAVRSFADFERAEDYPPISGEQAAVFRFSKLDPLGAGRFAGETPGDEANA